MNTTNENLAIELSNKLIFKTNKVVGKEHIYVTIRLNDECKNGHQDFAITGNIYVAGKPKTDKYYIAGGCIHEEISKHFPQFIPFVKLHLCDWEGIPTYAVENGFYHLHNGFNRVKADDPTFKNEYCTYYRITGDQFDRLSEAKNSLQFALLLQNLNILSQWKEEANKAIAQLETLTGKKFKPDSVKTQCHAPTPEEIQKEEEKQRNGYYTKEAEAERAKERKLKVLNGLIAERDKNIDKINLEFEVKKQVLEVGGESALKNCIFYSHTKQLAFNWMDSDYNNISQELINKIIAEIKLPEGVTIKTTK
jgi:hypothetical protein